MRTGGDREVPFAEVLCRRYEVWLTNDVEGDDLPFGWRTLVERTFEDIAGVVGSRRYVLHRLDMDVGLLSIGLVPTPYTQAPSSPEHARVLHFVECARIASQRLCQICGKLARSPEQQQHQPLCADHAQDLATPVAHVPRAEVASEADAVRRDAGRLEPTSTRVRLYRTSDVAAALDAQDDDRTECGDGGTTEHAKTLRRIVQRGEAGTWRTLAVPTHEQVTALDQLDGKAPHFGQVTAFVRRHVMAAITMNLPLTLPAIMLVGEPGFGKTWYVSHLAIALALPVRMLSMNATSLGDSLTGAYPVWRNARMGLVARTLLVEQVANPLFLVDEIDKPAAYNGEDPYRPYYSVLEPENAKSMVDDYLGFAMDASHASWVLAGNTVQNLPPPIVDRLVVMTTPAMDDAQRRVVIESVYAEANAARRSFFDPALPDGVVDRLTSLTARDMRRSLGEAMVRAAAAGRRVIHPDDVDEEFHRSRKRRSVGFASWS